MTERLPLRAVFGLLLGFSLAVLGLQLVPHDSTDELPSVAPLPSVSGLLGDLPAPAPDDEFRIFTIGASLTQGFPYAPIYSASYGTLLEAGLRAQSPAQRVVARPIARPALDSPALTQLVEDVLPYDPDLLIVTVGSNEYANRLFSDQRLEPDDAVAWISDRAGRARLLWRELPGDGMRWPAPRPGDTSARDSLEKRLVARVWNASPGEPQLGAPPFTEHERELLVQRLRRSMQRMDALARAHDVPLVFCIAVYGLGRFWPWGDQESGLGAEYETAVDRLALRFHLGQGEGVTEGEVLALLERDPERADLQFMHGLLLRRGGRTAEARAAFERARDLDPVPIHQTGRIRTAILEEAQILGRPVFDLDAPFRALAPDGIQGDRHYLDYGHLSAEGHRIVAAHLAQGLAARGLLPLRADFDPVRFDAATHEAVLATISEEERRTAAARMAMANGNYGLLFGNFRDALPYLRDGFQALPHDLDNAQRFIFCFAKLAGREREFGTGAQAQQQFGALYARLCEALQANRLNDWLDAYLQGR